jgi:predicted ATPase
VEEPGRRIVRQEVLGKGTALPWIEPLAFARRAVALALADRKEARRLHGWIFFDRGLIDAAVALQHWSGEPALARVRRSHRYYQRVFLAPPWPEIYVTDSERRHGFDAAVTEYQRLVAVYPSLGYEITVLPKLSVAERAEFILRTLEGSRAAAAGSGRESTGQQRRNSSGYAAG